MSDKLYDGENARIDEHAIGSTANYGTAPHTTAVVDRGPVNAGSYGTVSGDINSMVESDKEILVDMPRDKHMALFEDDSQQRPFVSNIINRLANYDGGVVPHFDADDEDIDGVGPKKKKVAPPKSRKMGMMMGVFFPCIQNIFGIILFIRFAWVVGTAGWLQAFFIVLMCCVCALVTAISLSAIATNGFVSSGGSYFMISRALGPEFGGAVGVLFYLGTTVSASLYIVGAVEIFLKYMVPQASIFGDISIPSNAFNNYRVYGTCLFLIMFISVLVGVRFVSKISALVLLCVIVSIVCIYIGIFVARPNYGPKVCYVGERLLSRELAYNKSTGDWQCTNGYNETAHTYSGVLYTRYCRMPKNGTEPAETDSTDNDCTYFKEHIVGLKDGFPGLASGIFNNNTWDYYNDHGDRIGFNETGSRDKGDILSDISTSFLVLIGIIFPAVTGFMSGSNRSGDLSDAQKSIPVGTISAVAFTSVIYITCVFFFAGCIEGQVLRDKFGESLGGGLILAHLAWPTPWVVIIGSFLSTSGAAIQSLIGAPRLLQAIACDGVIPFLNMFAVTTKSGEPVRALLLTSVIAEAGILIANIDNLAPIVSEFFLVCYGFVNLACALQTILRTPNWRPRFRYYHWTLAFFGVCECTVLMFLSSWYYAIVAIVIAAAIYKYIEYKGAEKEWGDGLRGLAMSAARFALLRLEEGPPHVKNWRPQLLILLKLTDKLEPKDRKMLTFSSQLKEGKGLTLVGSVLEGDYAERFADAQAAKQTVTALMKKEKAQGFAEVIVADSSVQGLSYLIQGSGVGGLTHNTVMLGWPHGWRHSEDEKAYKVFLDTLRHIANGQLAALIAKGIDQFPENTDRLVGTIDIWWIVHDGGLLMLLPFLLTQHKVWKYCKMRIFTVSQMDDNVEQIKKDLHTFLYHLRLPAEVHVVPLPDSAIRMYTYERALMMEQRTAMMKELRRKKKSKRSKKFVVSAQIVGDTSHEEPVTSSGGETSPTATERKLSPGTETPSLPTEDCWSSAHVILEEPEADASVVTTDRRGSADLTADELLQIKPDTQNVRRMHTAVRLNEVIVERSHEARLVIVNLPGVPKTSAGDENYMEYIEVLTEGIERVLMVRGGGREVITIYS